MDDLLVRIAEKANERDELEQQLEQARMELFELLLDARGSLPVTHVATAANMSRENVYYWFRKYDAVDFDPVV